MSKIPQKNCGSREEEGGAQHHAIHLTVMSTDHSCLWEDELFHWVRPRSKVTKPADVHEWPKGGK